MMKVAFVLSLLMALHGCDQPVHHNIALHDGRWGDYNEAKATKCALDAMVHGIDAAQITKLFNHCVFEQGLTI